MRSYIAEIPDGAYTFEDYFDNDGIVDEPVQAVPHADQERHGPAFRLHRHRRADARADQSRAHHDAVELLRRAEAHLPGGAGEWRRVPADQVQHPGRLPARREVPDAGRRLSRSRRPTARCRVRRARAGDPATHARRLLRHDRRDDGQRAGIRARVAISSSVFPYPGGYGGYNGGDGLVHGTTPQSMANFMSIEMSEHRYPVRFGHFALREDSGGAGKFRGGCGTTYSFEPWARCSRLGARRSRRSCAVRRCGREIRCAERGRVSQRATRSSFRRCAASTRSSRSRPAIL